MVSAPDTNWMSSQLTPASASAARAATNPYSTKLRPHLPHGCIPTPKTATRWSSLIVPPPSPLGPTGGRHRPPLPYEVLVFVVLVEDVQDELDLGADREISNAHPGDHLAHHDHLLVGQL